MKIQFLGEKAARICLLNADVVPAVGTTVRYGVTPYKVVEVTYAIELAVEASGPVEVTKFEAVEAWNRQRMSNAADPTGEVEEAEFVRLSDVLNLVSNWWATEDGYIAMSPFDARLHLEKHFRSAATEAPAMSATVHLREV